MNVDERADTITKFRFKQRIDELLADIQRSYDDNRIAADQARLQHQLDRLMHRYRTNQALGSLRYKLYEAQAYLHYLRGNRAAALRAIGMAVKIRGVHFDEAVQLKRAIKSGQEPAHIGRPQQAPQLRRRRLVRTIRRRIATTRANQRVLRVSLVVIVLLVVAIAGGYWKLVRPQMIRAACNNYATSASQRASSARVIFLTQLSSTSYTSLYNQCLQAHGL